MNDKTKALLDRAPEIMAALLCDKTMECCGKAKQCPYHSTDYNHISVGYGCDVDRLDADTAGLLKAYDSENAQLREQLAAVTAERDAAGGFMRKMNDAAEEFFMGGLIDDLFVRSRRLAGTIIRLFAEWRGPQGAREVNHAD